MIARPALRAAAAALVALPLAAALALGGATPAQAAVADLRSYMLTAPAAVADEASTTDAANVLAWRDSIRNYPDTPVYPATSAQPVKFGGVDLYGSGTTLQLVDAGDGSLRFRHGGADPWPASAGKPSHVPQAEWDACRAPAPSTFLQGIRQANAALRTAIGGGTDCTAVRAGWGAKAGSNLPDLPKASEDYDTLTAGNVNGSVCGAGSLTLSKPVQSWSTYGLIARYDFTWTYRDGGASCAMPADGGQSLLTSSTSQGLFRYFRAEVQDVRTGAIESSFPGGGRQGTTTFAGSASIVSSFVDTAAGVLRGSVEWRQSGTYSRANGYHALRVGWVRTCTESDLSCHRYTRGSFGPFDGEFDPIGTPIGGGGFPDEGEQKLVTTIKDASGNTSSCETGGFFWKESPVTPLPCEPKPLGGGQVEHSREVSIQPKSGGMPGAGSQPSRIVFNSQPTTAYKDWRNQNPECKGATRCALDLKSPGGGSCFDMGPSCANWKSQPSGYTCTYGGKAVAIEQCSVYGPVFDDAGRSGGGGYEPKPGVPGNTSSPVTPGGKGGGAEQCMADGWSGDNPIDNAVRPMVCALADMFIPDSFALDSTFAGIQGDVAGSSAGRLATAVGSIADTFVVPESCGGLPFEVDMFGVSVDEQLFDTCEAPWDFISGFVKTTIGGLLMLGTFLACTRYMSAALGFVGFGMQLDNDAQAAYQAALKKQAKA